MLKRSWFLIQMLMIVTLAGCGGGSGSTNRAPVATVVASSGSAVAGDTVTLNGESSGDPDGQLVSFSWEQISGEPLVTLEGADTARASFVVPDVSASVSFVFRLTVTDNEGASATAQVTVNVVAAIVPPAALASASVQEAAGGENVVLDGSASNDSDGQLVAYKWVQTAGTSVVLQAADQTIANFAAPELPSDETLTFSLTVTDDDGEMSTDSVDVLVRANRPPNADAGDNVAAADLTRVTLDASASTDADGDILTFTWTQISGPTVVLQDADTASPAFVTPRGGDPFSLSFNVQVSDPDGANTADTVSVNVTPAHHAVFVAQNKDVYEPGIGNRRLYVGTPGLEPIDVTTDEALPGSPRDYFVSQLFSVSPDGQYVAYMVYDKGASRYPMALSLLDGVTQTNLMPQLFVGDDSKFFWSPDSQRLAFTSTADGQIGLYVYTVTDGSVTKVSGVQGAGRDVAPNSVQWSPDSLWLVIKGDLRADGIEEPFLVDVVNATITPIMNVIPARTVNMLGGPTWNPGNTLLAAPMDVVTPGVYEVYIYNPATAMLMNASGNLADAPNVYNLEWSPTGEHVAYLRLRKSPRLDELYLAAVAADGTPGSPVCISDNAATNAARVTRGYEWAPDASSLAFIANIDDAGKQELYIVATDGARTKLSGVLTATANVDTMTWSAAGNEIFYIVDDAPGGTSGLFSVAVSDGAISTVVEGFPVGSEISFWAWSPSRDRVALVGDLETDEQVELYVTLPVVNASLTKLSPTPVSGGDVTNPRWSANGEYIAFAGDLRTDNVNEGYFVTLANPGVMTAMAESAVAGGILKSWNWSADGAGLLLRGDLVTTEVFELFWLTPGNSLMKFSGTITSDDGDAQNGTQDGDVISEGWVIAPLP